LTPTLTPPSPRKVCKIVTIGGGLLHASPGFAQRRKNHPSDEKLMMMNLEKYWTVKVEKII
jgi:hypothetical protein